MSSEKVILELSEEGRRKIESVALTKLEASALIGASKMSLKDDLTKNTKLTRAVLADTLMKILPLCEGLFKKRRPNPKPINDAPDEGTKERWRAAQSEILEEIEKETEKSILAAVVETTTDVNSSKHSDSSNEAVECPDRQRMPVCRFFLVGNCKFEKSEDKKCPYSHPKVCKAYDKKGPSACHEKECPQGLHRKICDKLINGNCRRKPEKCGFYHPTHLRRANSQAKKKKKEEESSDKSEWLQTIMDGIKKFSLSPQIMQFPMSPVITVLAIPPPPTSKRGKKG